MKRLFIVIVVATLGYAGWWFYAANALQRDVEAWFADQRDAGWQASYADISVQGFPSRTDLTLTDPSLTSPDGQFGWSAPFFQILGLTYKRGHVIVAWPDTQTVTTPDGPMAISSDGLRASVIHASNNVIRANVEATTLNLEGPEQTVALAGLTAALEKIEPAPASYRIALFVDGIAVSNPRISGTLAPDSLASLRSEMTVDLNAPITLDSGTTDTPRPTQITVPRSEITYGALTFRVTGDAAFDPQGRATGEVSLEADNWRESLNAARANGDLPPGLTDGLIDLLSMLATFGGSRDALDITLGLKDGTVLLGPLPIGTLPPLQFD
ncbi:DUF2125 domain-containing protein [Marivita sp. S6314]|uniref:DUF2125 domain-containing protein n=1 Tax=Marivita sp. S6314 TaxID=2926406 RepID=UPI001FF119FC|nr:DUF2125 domain-containing protein [Marivita sp. S6314]MCK0150235.1 DUF2125 domain-containing protein [Marivita sp. S6314]